MKKLLLALPILLLLPTPVLSQYRSSQRGYYEEQVCFKDVIREEYVPGNRNRRGYVVRRIDKQEVPCNNRRHNTYNQGSYRDNTDNNSCIEGSVIGAILGGGLGGAFSRGNGRWLGVPGGAVAGALIGCQIDGG